MFIFSRRFSSVRLYTTMIRTERRPGGIAIIRLAKEPVNSMDTTFWQQLKKEIDTLENDQSCRSVLFLSDLKRNVFTAGNDLNELYAPKSSNAQYQTFWHVSNTVLANLYRSRLLTACGIKGACPAGGFGLAMVCDLRVATKDATMGLNEVQLGVSVPAKWQKLLASIVGHRKAEKMCQFSQVISAGEAIDEGILDALVESAAELEQTALQMMTKILKLPDAARVLTKRDARNALAQEWADPAWLTEEANFAWGLLSRPETIKALDAVFARLSAPKL